MAKEITPQRTDKILLTPDDIVKEYRYIITSSLQNF